MAEIRTRLAMRLSWVTCPDAVKNCVQICNDDGGDGSSAGTRRVQVRCHGAALTSPRPPLRLPRGELFFPTPFWNAALEEFEFGHFGCAAADAELFSASS